MNFKKTISVLLVAVLVCVLLAGCSQYNPETVMTINDRALTSGEYLLFQLSAFSEAASMVDDTSYQGINVLKANIEGQSVRSWVAENTLAYAKEYTFVEQEYERRKLSVDYENNFYLEYMVSQSYSQQQSFFENNGVGNNSFYSVSANSYKQSDIFTDIYLNEESDKNIPLEELIEAFRQNFVSFESISFPRYDGETSKQITEEQIKEVEALAGEMLALINGGSEPEAAFNEIYPKVMSTVNSDAAVPAFSDTMTESGLVNKNDSNAVDTDLAGAVQQAGVGAYGVFASDNRVVLYHSLPVLVEGNEYEGHETELAQILKIDEFSAWIAESSAKLEAVIDEKAVAYYSPQKIKLS